MIRAAVKNLPPRLQLKSGRYYSWGQETLHKVALAYVQHQGLANPLETSNGGTKTKRKALNLSP